MGSGYIDRSAHGVSLLTLLRALYQSQSGSLDTGNTYHVFSLVDHRGD